MDNTVDSSLPDELDPFGSDDQDSPLAQGAAQASAGLLAAHAGWQKMVQACGNNIPVLLSTLAKPLLEHLVQVGVFKPDTAAIVEMGLQQLGGSLAAIQSDLPRPLTKPPVDPAEAEARARELEEEAKYPAAVLIERYAIALAEFARTNPQDLADRQTMWEGLERIDRQVWRWIDSVQGDGPVDAEFEVD